MLDIEPSSSSLLPFFLIRAITRMNRGENRACLCDVGRQAACVYVPAWCEEYRIERAG